MIVALEPIRVPRLGETCVVLPNLDEEGEHRGSTPGVMIVHVKLPMGVVELTMCGDCLADLIESEQGGDPIITAATLRSYFPREDRDPNMTLGAHPPMRDND